MKHKMKFQLSEAHQELFAARISNSLRCVLSFLFLNGPCSVVDRPVSFMFMLFLCKKDMVQVAVYRRWCLNVRQAIHVEHSVLSSPCAVLAVCCPWC